MAEAFIVVGLERVSNGNCCGMVDCVIRWRRAEGVFGDMYDEARAVVCLLDRPLWSSPAPSLSPSC